LTNYLRLSWLTLLLLVSSLGLSWAQLPAVTPAKTPAPVRDSLLIDTDSIPTGMRDNGVLVNDSTQRAEKDTLAFTSDTTQVTAQQEAAIRKIIPKQATLRSLVLPGLGQAYNKQYYKIPFIYAGFGVMGYLFVRYRNLAQESADGYRLLLYGTNYYGVDPSLPESIRQEYVTNIKPASVIINEQRITTTTTAKAAYDLFRRYRDLNILLSIALWGLNIVEANVAAHLKTFDLSDNISMRVQPAVLPMPGLNMAPGVRVAFTFK
jgi:hypothetical protein